MGVVSMDKLSLWRVVRAGVTQAGRSVMLLLAAGLPAAALAQGAPVTAPLLVPKNLTYWEMFAHATIVVKLVMILLLLASVATWTIWIAKQVEMSSANRRLRSDLAALEGAGTLDKVGALRHGAPAGMLQVARSEFARTGPIGTVEAGEGLKERIAARFVNVEAGAIERMLRSASVLATVGAITPFVGLFGTVWGIMNSFIGISQSNTTNLAVVAPGIAEALLATAMGLVAAIPAVIMYNHVARTIAGYRRRLAEASTHVACLVSHEVDMQLAHGHKPARAAVAAV